MNLKVTPCLTSLRCHPCAKFRRRYALCTAQALQSKDLEGTHEKTNDIIGLVVLAFSIVPTTAWCASAGHSSVWQASIRLEDLLRLVTSQYVITVTTERLQVDGCQAYALHHCGMLLADHLQHLSPVLLWRSWSLASVACTPPHAVINAMIHG